MMKRKIITALLIFGVVSILFLLLRPFLLAGFPETDDGTWMIVRLTAFYQAFRDGQFPVRFLGRLNNHFGYPVAEFLYPGFLYIGSVFHVLGFSFVSSVKLIMAGSVIVAAGAIFFWLRSFFPFSASLLGTMMFLLQPYISYDLFVRGSVGELLAIAAASVTIMAIERGMTVMIPLSFALLLVSHNTLALFFTVFILFYVFLRRRIRLIPLLFIGAVMTVFFWLPALMEQSMVTFDTVTISDPSVYAGITMTLLLTSIPFLLLAIFAYVKGTYIRSFSKVLLVMLGVLVFLTTPMAKPFWNTSIFLKFVQFPFRLFAFFPFLAAFFTALAFVSGRKVFRTSFVLLALVTAFVFFFLRMGAVHVKDIPESLYTTNEATTTVRDEYMPRWVKEKPSERTNERLEIESGDADIEIVSLSTRQVLANITAESTSVVRFNTIYYPGWVAVVDGEKTPISYSNQRGLIEITVLKGKHEVTFLFQETPLRLFSDFVSTLGIIMYGVFLFRMRHSFFRTEKGKRTGNI